MVGSLIKRRLFAATQIAADFSLRHWSLVRSELRTRTAGTETMDISGW